MCFLKIISNLHISKQFEEFSKGWKWQPLDSIEDQNVL